MSIFRTEEMYKKYKEECQKSKYSSECALCKKEALKEYENWKIVQNNFPYDKISKTHEMLIPIRHCAEEDLSVIEEDELKKIKKDILNSDYDFILESTYKNKSIPEHFHLHLIVVQDNVE